MSLKTNIYNALKADTELNALIAGEVHFYILPEEFDRDKSAVLFTLSKGEPLRALGGMVLQNEHTVTLTCISPDVSKVYDIAYQVEEVMSDFDATDQSGPGDPGYDPDFENYVLELSFTIKS